MASASDVISSSDAWVDPLQVLDGDHERATPALSEDELPDPVEASASDRVGADRGQRVRAFFDAEEVEEVGRELGRVQPDLVQASPHPLRDRARVAGLRDAE